jgi:hypothetical protein
MMMVPNVQVYPLPRSACQSCRATLDFAEEEERTKPGPGTDGFERLSGGRTLQTLSEHRPSGRGAAVHDLCKDIGDQRVE